MYVLCHTFVSLCHGCIPRGEFLCQRQMHFNCLAIAMLVAVTETAFHSLSNWEVAAPSSFAGDAIVERPFTIWSSPVCYLKTHT